MDFDNIISEVDAIVEEYVGKMERTRAERCGLDARCGRVYVGRECIAVDKHNDSALQYYGGFEYVDKDCRYELGTYVFYSANDDRVQEHLEEFFEAEDADLA
jgi:hypothetical protein